jgi:hypothetical protein
MEMSLKRQRKIRGALAHLPEPVAYAPEESHGRGRHRLGLHLRSGPRSGLGRTKRGVAGGGSQGDVPVPVPRRRHSGLSWIDARKS